MLRTGKRFLLTLSCKGHVYYFIFDRASYARLFDSLIDFAEDRDNPLTWQHVFEAIDAVGRALGRAKAPRRRVSV